MKQFVTYVAILGITAVFFCSCRQKKEVPERTSIAEIGERLYDHDQTVRRHASYQLKEERNSLVHVLMNKLRELSKTTDTSYQSALHLTVQALGEWRVEDAVPLLAKMVDYQIDRTTMTGWDKLPTYAYYPAADALRKIGGEYVHKLIVKRLCTEEDAEVVRICVWVLFEAYGEDVAKLLLEAEQARTEDPAIRERLAAAKKLLTEGPAILRRPKSPE